MRLDLYSDLVCPWCYIGKRRLEQALASYAGEVDVHYQPFHLDPSPVPQPRPVLERLAEKFGGPQRAQEISQRVRAAGADVGLDIRFDRAVTANTFNAHRLVWFAGQRGLAAQTVEILHRAHFTDGIDIGSLDALVKIGVEAGLPEAETRQMLTSDAGTTEVQSALDTGRALGVTSVPTFVLAGKYAITGAQDANTIRSAFEQVAQREAAAN